jgi:hypothetical protein
MLSDSLTHRNADPEAVATDGGEERNRGVLTPSDRQYIRGSESERVEMFSRASRAQRRRRIRNRTMNATLDIQTLAYHGADETLYTPVFGESDDDDGVSVDRLQRSMPYMVLFLMRAIHANEPHRPIERIEDVTAVLEPVIENFETGIELYLNQERNVRADFEITAEISKLQTLEGVINELELRRSPLTGQDRRETRRFLTSAGISEERITELLGEEPDDDGDESEFSLEELAAMSTEQLAVLLDAGRISVDEQITALERKYDDED